MAAEQQAVRAQQPIKISAQHTVALEATAGSSLESAASSGQVRLTNTPKLGEAEAFFPANPAIVGELAQNKPVKELAASDRTASGGLLRTISDVITELRQKHQDRKRTRIQEASAPGSPSQAKFRKGLETAFDSPSKAEGSPLKSNTSVGTPKRAASGFGDKVPRMTCWGTSDQAAVQKKPSLAERYSAWKAKQQEMKAARTAKSPAVPNAKRQQAVIVEEKATAAEAAQFTKQDASPEAAAAAGVIITPLAE